jgi:peroxiredoxin Q/BCP
MQIGVLFGGVLMAAAVALAGEDSPAVAAGAAAPEFSVPSTAGTNATLAGLKGKWVVLYFYPRSFTPGCTAEACSLRDGYAALQALGAVILGASLDDLERQKKFKAEHNLPFELLADSDKALAKAYNVLGLGGLVAKRHTYLIDPDGKIAQIITDVKTGEHERQVREALEALQAKQKP